VIVNDFDDPTVRHPWDHRTVVSWRPPWASAEDYPDSGSFAKE
jgi:hypothetical protein